MWEKNFWCGNTAIGPFCPVSVLLLKQQKTEQQNSVLGNYQES